MRISVKDMMRAQGIDPVARRQEAIEQAKKMEKLSPEERAEVKRLYKEYKEKMEKEMAKEEQQQQPREAKVPVNSQHLDHQERLKREQRGGGAAGGAAAKPSAAKSDAQGEKTG